MLKQLFDRDMYFEPPGLRHNPGLRQSFLEQVSKLKKEGVQSSLPSSVTRENAVNLFLERALDSGLASSEDSFAFKLFIATAMGCVRWVERGILRGISDLSTCIYAEHMRLALIEPDLLVEDCVTYLAPLGLFFTPELAYSRALESAIVLGETMQCAQQLAEHTKQVATQLRAGINHHANGIDMLPKSRFDHLPYREEISDLALECLDLSRFCCKPAVMASSLL